MCDDCCICPQTTWQFMFLDNMIIRSNHPKNLAFLEHRNHPLHITFWRLFFSLQASAQPAWRFRFDAWMNIHPSYGLWAERGGFGLPLQWRTKSGGFIFDGSKISSWPAKEMNEICMPWSTAPSSYTCTPPIAMRFLCPLGKHSLEYHWIKIPSCCISKVYHPSNINRATLPDRGLMDWKWLEDNLLFQKNAGSQHQTVILGQSSH